MFRFVLLLVFIIAAVSAAAQTPDSLFFGIPIAPQFSPVDGFFLLDRGDGNILRVQALLQTAAHDEKTAITGSKWLLGAKLPYGKDTHRANIAALVVGDSVENFLAIPPLSLSSSDAVLTLGQQEALRSHLDTLKEQMYILRDKVKLQAESLSRMRADAAIIADVEKIRATKEEIELAEQSIVRLDGDILALQESVKEAKRRPAPKNHSTREAELTRQLAELASLAKVAEGSEGNRGTAAELSLQAKLALIESTRFDDIGTLQRTLDRLNDTIKRIAGEEGSVPESDRIR